MTREQFSQAAALLDKISNQNVRIEHLEDLKELANNKNKTFVLGDNYSSTGRIEIEKSNALAVLDAEILLCKAKISNLESDFALL